MKSKKKSAPPQRLFAPHTIVVLFLLFLSGLLFYLLSSKNGYHIPSIKAEPLRGKVIPPTTGSFIGVSLYEQNYASLLAIQNSRNKHFAIVGVYQSWGGENNRFNAEWARKVRSNGSIPLITWQPWVPVAGYDISEAQADQEQYRLETVSSGKYDAYIIQFARDTKAYKKQIMLRFAHEMNGNWYPWGSAYNTPEEYIAAWRHVHTLFMKEGATNVTWVWSPNEIYTDSTIPYSGEITAFYPGDEYVDWVGFSAFNWAGRFKENVWRDPEGLYAETVAALSEIGKPILIAETASTEVIEGTKAEWIESFGQYIKSNPLIKGVIWFNIKDKDIDWRIDSSPSSAAAFDSAIDTYFIQEFTE